MNFRFMNGRAIEGDFGKDLFWITMSCFNSQGFKKDSLFNSKPVETLGLE